MKFDKIEDAITALKNGNLIIVCDDANRENEGDLVILGEYATPDKINFMLNYGRGLVCMPVHESIAYKLGLHPMVCENTDRFSTAFTVSIDHVSCTTGISATERSNTIIAATKNNCTANDFRKPGHIFPLIAKSNGILERVGHTEASIDLANLCGATPVTVICEILNDNGETAKYDDLVSLAKTHNLTMIHIADLVEYRKKHDKLITREVNANLPTQFGDFEILGYSSILDHKEHVAIIKGLDCSDKAPLVRIHSSCLTGDIFHSKRCDCGEQLEKSLIEIEKAGCGVLIYLNQEGRDIGLINKLKAYKLQQQNVDTVEANHQLGFATDLREYVLAAQILKDLNINKIRLITNNPNKIQSLENYGIAIVERIYIPSTIYPENERYLQTKKSKMGHLV